jgi:SpoVK/Ycf46/Vps4 family AAA+-type ATPase
LLFDLKADKLSVADLQKLASSKTDQNSAISDLFQEAELSEAIIFFDECEAVFNHRGTVLNSLLTSIERFRGLVFLATNKPLDIDEAMHRRISKVYYFLPPNYQQRFRLWDSFKKTGLSFQANIDWNSISLKFAPYP